jgi:oligopeptide transport system substrate-binding protein
MDRINYKQISALILLASLACTSWSCNVASSNELYFGKTDPPARNIFRYVTGDEPESLDPVVSNGQPEARIYMALYDGLVEYHPKTLAPIPALAEKWVPNNDSSEFIFYLRHNGRWSNGDPIDANDFVYSFRRMLSPQVASRNAYMGYYIKYAQAFNEGAVFVRDPAKGTFLLARDFDDNVPAESVSGSPIVKTKGEYPPSADQPNQPPDSAQHEVFHTPLRLTLPGDQKSRTKLLNANPKLQAAIQGKELVPVKAEDLGIEAIDQYTLRICLTSPAPFFVGMLAHQAFRIVPRKIVEQYGAQWAQPEHIVTCGPFKVRTWRPYDKLILERDPMYWDAASVKLDELHFYPMSDNPSIMNVYKVGEIDAVLNHTVPNAWLDVVRTKKDYMNGIEAGIDYLTINVTKAPMNDARVRKAFNMSIDKTAWAEWRRVVKPLTAFTPENIFQGYVQPKGDAFNPEQARKLLGDAGYPVTKNADGSFSCPKWPAKDVEYIYNTQESNKAMAEWMQAQWKQNLGVTITLRNMDWKTFLVARAKLDYNGFARSAWGADYMDPFTFLSLFDTGGDSGTGWQDAKYSALLGEANRSLDPKKRYELLAQAEAYMLEAQPVIPLDTSSVNFVKKPYVKGMYPNAGSLYPWKFVYIERDPSKWDFGTPNLAE